MPIRISTIISFVLILANVMYWGVFVVQSYDRYVLWSRGKTAAVLPIENYQKSESNKKTYYVADVNVKLDSGEMITIHRKPVTLSQIEASQQPGMKAVVVPHQPKRNHFIGNEQQPFRTLVFACLASVIGFVWFRARRA